MPTRHHSTSLAPLALVLLVACSGAVQHDEPRLELTPLGSAGNRVRLAWSSPLRNLTGWTLEGRRGDEPWIVLEASIPPETTWAELEFPPTALDATRYAFRMAALTASGRTGYGNEVAHFLPVRAPLVALPQVPATFSEGAGVTLGWTRTSAAASEERLLRYEVSRGGEVGGWTSLPLPPQASTYTDLDLSGWVDGARYRYRLVSAAGAHESAAVEVETPPAPVAPPWPVTVTISPSGAVHLAWTFRSTLATEVEVSRWDAGAGEVSLGSLPRAIGSLDDQVGPGRHTYLLTCRDPSGTVPQAGTTAVFAANVDPASSDRLAASALLLPAAEGAVMTPDGQFALVSASPSQGFGALRAPATAPAWSFPATPTLYSPLLLPGPGGEVHAVYSWYDGAALPIEHAWHDGQGYHAEEIWPDGYAGGGYSGGVMGVAPDGSLRVAWRSGAVLQVASNATGAWVATAVPLGPGLELGAASAMAFEPSGALQVLAVASGVAELHRQATDGTWTVLATPPAAGAIAVLADDTTLLAYTERTAGPNEDSTWVVERTSAGWGTPVRLGAGPLEALAVSPDRTRAAVVTAWGPASLYLLEGGAWTALPLTPFAWRASVGFDPGGKAWVLDGLDLVGTAQPITRAYGLYRER